jgi:hypothetical protein
MRTMAGTIPASLGRVPVHVAPQMRAHCRENVKLTIVATADCDLVETVAHDPALTRFQFVRGIDLGRHQVFGEVFDSSDILADEIHCRGHGCAGRVVDIRPLTAAVNDNILQQNAGQRAVRHALPGVAGRDQNALVTGINANEAAIIDRVHHLPGPARDLLADLWHALRDPGCERLETDGAVIGFTTLVVFATNDEVFGRSRAGLQADVVIRIGHVPVESVGERTHAVA